MLVANARVVTGDSDRLTSFADNLVPHVLRVEGVLSYDPVLAARIDAGELLVPGSPEEMEIRASAIWAVEQVAEAVNATGGRVNAAEVDCALWRGGQARRYKAVPWHRCRAPFY